MPTVRRGVLIGGGAAAAVRLPSIATFLLNNTTVKVDATPHKIADDDARAIAITGKIKRAIVTDIVTHIRLNGTIFADFTIPATTIPSSNPTDVVLISNPADVGDTPGAGAFLTDPVDVAKGDILTIDIENSDEMAFYDGVATIVVRGN